MVVYHRGKARISKLSYTLAFKIFVWYVSRVILSMFDIKSAKLSLKHK